MRPGKLLTWVASVLKAKAAGLDYSETGVATCRMLFDALGPNIDLHHDDFFNHHLPPASFDVASLGLIEHFDDARPGVKKHFDLVKPGDVALIAVPDYGGMYGKLQRWCDAPNLALHNLEIMNPSALMALATSPDVASVRAYPFGAVSPWFVGLDKRLSPLLAKAISLGVNAVGSLQPVTIEALAQTLVLEIHKRKTA